MNITKIREGDRYRDIRYGIVEIIAVTEKTVWYKFLRQNRTHKTSKRRAKSMKINGPNWSDKPRWS